MISLLFAAMLNTQTVPMAAPPRDTQQVAIATITGRPLVSDPVGFPLEAGETARDIQAGIRDAIMPRSSQHAVSSRSEVAFTDFQDAIARAILGKAR